MFHVEHFMSLDRRLFHVEQFWTDLTDTGGTPGGKCVALSYGLGLIWRHKQPRRPPDPG
jgi:hypothetical protein